MRVDLARTGLNSVSSNFLKLRYNFLDNVALDIDRVKIFLEVRVWEFIAALELSIVVTFLLYGVISEVNKSVCNVLEIEVLAARAEVALVVPVTLQVSVDGGQQGVAPNIKLPSLVEKGLFNVLLYDVWPFLAVHVRVRHDFLYLRHLAANLNATAPVGVLARLDDPYLLT